MKKYTIILFTILIICTIWFYKKNPLEPRIKIGNHIVSIELAITDSEKEKGLGYRDSLKENHGMLFVYDHDEQYRFWMKGMQFPIDIIWIKDKTIKDITKNVPVPSGTTLPTYMPREPVNLVLEVNAGSVEKWNIHIGDSLTFLK